MPDFHDEKWLQRLEEASMWTIGGIDIMVKNKQWNQTKIDALKSRFLNAFSKPSSHDPHEQKMKTTQENLLSTCGSGGPVTTCGDIKYESTCATYYTDNGACCGYRPTDADGLPICNCYTKSPCFWKKRAIAGKSYCKSSGNSCQ